MAHDARDMRWVEDAKRPATRATRIHRTDKAPSPWQQAVLIDGKHATG